MPNLDILLVKFVKVFANFEKLSKSLQISKKLATFFEKDYNFCKILQIWQKFAHFFGKNSKFLKIFSKLCNHFAKFSKSGISKKYKNCIQT